MYNCSYVMSVSPSAVRTERLTSAAERLAAAAAPCRQSCEMYIRRHLTSHSTLIRDINNNYQPVKFNQSLAERLITHSYKLCTDRCIYLRQRSSDGSVNKTILKPWLALATRRQYVYVGFSQRKIPRSSAARWQPR